MVSSAGARACGRAPAAVLLAEQHAHEAPGLRVLAGRAAGAHVAQRRQRARVAARHGRLKLGALGDQVALSHDLRGGPAVSGRACGRAGARPRPAAVCLCRACPERPLGGRLAAAPGAPLPPRRLLTSRVSRRPGLCGTVTAAAASAVGEDATGSPLGRSRIRQASVGPL